MRLLRRRPRELPAAELQVIEHAGAELPARLDRQAHAGALQCHTQVEDYLVVGFAIADSVAQSGTKQELNLHEERALM